MTRIGSCLLFALALLVAGENAGAQAAAPGYHVIKKIFLKGEGSWDYLTLDSDARRLYIARSNRVMVMDVDNGTLIGEVANTPGVHGVALVPTRATGAGRGGQAFEATPFASGTFTPVTRFLPARLLVYIARSALIISSSAVCPSSG